MVFFNTQSGALFSSKQLSRRLLLVPRDTLPGVKEHAYYNHSCALRRKFVARQLRSPGRARGCIHAPQQMVMFLVAGFTELCAEVFSMALSHAGMSTDKDAYAGHDGDAAAVAGEELVKFVIETALMKFVASSPADDVLGAAVKRAIVTSDVADAPPKASSPNSTAAVHAELRGMATAYVEQIVAVAVSAADDAAVAAVGVAITLADAIIKDAIDDDAAAAADGVVITFVDAIMEDAMVEPEEAWVVVDSNATIRNV
jgi:hypothetical protein